MISETSIIDIAGSMYVRVPANMAEYFKIKDKRKCKIEDIDKNKVEITFPVW